MAKLRIYKSIENKDYLVVLENDPAALSSSDAERMQKFGEPEINLGGTIAYTTQSGSGTFTLPDKYARVRSDFPQRVEFDSTSTEFSQNIDEKIAGYITAITSRFSKAFSNPAPGAGETFGLRDLPDDYSGEQVVNV